MGYRDDKEEEKVLDLIFFSKIKRLKRMKRRGTSWPAREVY